ncbi:hypothetical protein HPB47_025816, partial [Ixodes persulcatus]
PAPAQRGRARTARLLAEPAATPLRTQSPATLAGLQALVPGSDAPFIARDGPLRKLRFNLATPALRADDVAALLGKVTRHP